MKKQFEFENVNAYIHFRVMDTNGRERQLYLAFNDNENWLGAPNIFDRFNLLGGRIMRYILKRDKTVFGFKGTCYRGGGKSVCSFLIYRKIGAVYRPIWVKEDGSWEVAKKM